MEGARFKYEFLNGRVRYVVDENGTTNVYEVWPGKEPKLLETSALVLTKGAEVAAARLGIPVATGQGRVRQTYSVQIGNALLRAFEDEAIPKRYIGGWIYEATVEIADQLVDVAVNVFHRRVTRVSPRVQKFATVHAIERAKERYDLVLDAQTAEAMVSKLVSGEAEVQPGGRDGLERAELVYDQEVFTVVWNPETAKIVTVTPTGGYRQSVDLLGD